MRICKQYTRLAMDRLINIAIAFFYQACQMPKPVLVRFIVLFAPMFFLSIGSAQTMEELYELRTSFHKSIEPSERDMASFFIYIGQMELQELQWIQQLTDEQRELKSGLEEALKPLNDLTQFEMQTGQIVDGGKERSKLNGDISIARNVFNTLGPETVAQKVNWIVNHEVQLGISKSLLNSNSVECLILEKRLAACLKLTDQQRDRIEKLANETGDQLRVGPGKEFTDLQSLFRDHWIQIQQALDSSQRKEAKRLVGEPIHWYRSVRKLSYRGTNSGHMSFRMIGKEFFLAEKLGKEVSELTEEDFKNEGIELVHDHFFLMLQCPFIWDELELSKRQRQQIQSGFFDYVKKEAHLIPGNHKLRLNDILIGKAELPNYVVKNFLEDQQTAVRHYEFQILTGDYETSFGLLHPQVKVHLELTKSQDVDLTEMAKKFEEQRNELEQKLAIRREKMQSEFSDKVAAILTKEQHDLYTRFTGKTIGTDRANAK
jgi:hypothetical protein